MDRVRHIIKGLDPALVTFAHQGAAAYREAFDLLYRREATHSNAMWQADLSYESRRWHETYNYLRDVRYNVMDVPVCARVKTMERI